MSPSEYLRCRFQFSGTIGVNERHGISGPDKILHSLDCVIGRLQGRWIALHPICVSVAHDDGIRVTFKTFGFFGETHDVISSDVVAELLGIGLLVLVVLFAVYIDGFASWPPGRQGTWDVSVSE